MAFELSSTDYLALGRQFQGLALSPAELHGSLCGFLCAGGLPQPGRWLEQLCIDDSGLAADSEPLLEALRRATTLLLDDPEFRFSPLLPNSDSAMAGRVEALASWCTGFLGGYGLHGNETAMVRSAEATDALRDLDRIAHFGYEAGEDDEDESAFAEILEYVRMAVILLRQEGAPKAAPPDATRH
jgi:uncharacterized protein